MSALVLDSSTAGFDALLERRRRSRLARLDEVWAAVSDTCPKIVSPVGKGGARSYRVLHELNSCAAAHPNAVGPAREKRR